MPCSDKTKQTCPVKVIPILPRSLVAPVFEMSLHGLGMTQELQNDPLGILRPASKLQHNLHLASAYAAIHDARDGGPALQKQKRKMDPKYHEPKVGLHRCFVLFCQGNHKLYSCCAAALFAKKGAFIRLGWSLNESLVFCSSQTWAVTSKGLWTMCYTPPTL